MIPAGTGSKAYRASTEAIHKLAAQLRSEREARNFKEEDVLMSDIDNSDDDFIDTEEVNQTTVQAEITE